jgi:hypothetical protein
VAQPGAAGAPTACGVEAGEAGAEEAEDAAEDAAADDAAADDAAADEAADDGADRVVDAEDTGGGAEEDELTAAQPATTAPAAAIPASLSNNETEPVITKSPFLSIQPYADRMHDYPM